MLTVRSFSAVVDPVLLRHNLAAVAGTIGNPAFIKAAIPSVPRAAPMGVQYLSGRAEPADALGKKCIEFHKLRCRLTVSR